MSKKVKITYANEKGTFDIKEYTSTNEAIKELKNIESSFIYIDGAAESPETVTLEKLEGANLIYVSPVMIGA